MYWYITWQDSRLQCVICFVKIDLFQLPKYIRYTN